MKNSTVQGRRAHAKVYLNRCTQSGCGYMAVPLSSLCRKHLRAKKYRGHPLAGLMLRWNDVRPVWDVARAYLKKNPPPPKAIQTLEQNVLSPHASLTISRTEDGWTPGMYVTARWKLREALDWWRDPASEKKFMKGGLKRRTDPVSIFAVLLAVTLYCDERQWGKGDAGKIALALAFLKMRKLRHVHSISYKRGTARTVTVPVPANVRRLLGQLLAETVGGYLLVTARAICGERDAENARIAKAMPKMIITPTIIRERKPIVSKPLTIPRYGPEPSPPTVTIVPEAEREDPKTLPPRYPRPPYHDSYAIPAILEWQQLEDRWKRSAGVSEEQIAKERIRL